MTVEYYVALEERSQNLTAKLARVRGDQKPNPTRLTDPFYMVGTRAATMPQQTFTLGVERFFLEEVDPHTKLYALGNSRGIDSVADLLTYLSRSDITVRE